MAVARYKTRRRWSTKRRGPSPALKKTQAQVLSLRQRLRKRTAGGSGVVTVGKDWQNALKLAAGVNGGAAAGGALAATMPEIAGFDSRIVAGGGLMALGAFFLKGDAAAITVCAGAGMVAGFTQDYVQTMVSAANGSTPPANE